MNQDSGAESLFGKTTVYHSNLVVVTEHEPLTVIFTALPERSTKDKKKHWIPFKVPGDPGAPGKPNKDYQYSIDNPAIAIALSTVPLRVPVRIKAYGTKDDVANQKLELIDSPGSVERLPQAAPQAPQAEAPRAPEPPRASTTIERDVWQAMFIAGTLISDFVEQFPNLTYNEATQALVATILIDHRKSGTPYSKAQIPLPKRLQRDKPAAPSPTPGLDAQLSQAASAARTEPQRRVGPPPKPKWQEDEDDLPF